MNTWKVILATIVIWGAGVVTGGLIISYSGWPSDGRQRAPRPPGPPPWMVPGKEIVHHGEKELQLSFDRLRGDFLLHASHELKLTHEQHERIEKIIRDSQESSRKIWEQVAPQMRKDLVETKEKILAELSPDQRTRFEELLKQQQRPRRPSPPRGNLATTNAAPQAPQPHSPPESTPQTTPSAPPQNP